MPAEQAPRPVRVRIGLSAEDRRALDGFAQAMRWPADDAAKILLAYPAAIADGEGLSQAEVREALGVDVPAEADDPGTAQERLLGFFRRHGRDGGEPGAGGGKAAGGDGEG